MLKNVGEREQIIEYLRELDETLAVPCTLVLCGSAAILLQDIQFRGTADIDLAEKLTAVEAMQIQAFMKKRPGSGMYIDMRAAGVFQSLVDASDRYVLVDVGLENITLYVISLFDWVVSKLNSPKLADIYSIPDVSNYLLELVGRHMDDYGGISEEKARKDLEYAKRDCAFVCVGFYSGRQIVRNSEGCLFWNNRPVDTSFKWLRYPPVEFLNGFESENILIDTDGDVVELSDLNDAYVVDGQLKFTTECNGLAVICPSLDA